MITFAIHNLNTNPSSMKKITFLLLLLLACTNLAHAQWQQVTDIQVNSSASYMATGGNNIFVSTSRGVYKSADNGAHFALANNGLNGAIPDRMSINGTTVMGGGVDTVYITNNLGASWTRQPMNMQYKSGVSAILFTGNTIFASNSYYNNGSEGMHKSTDNGATWTPSSNGMLNGIATMGVYCMTSTANNTNIFAGVHNNAPDGVYRTTDNGANWSLMTAGIPTSTIFALSSIGNTIFAGTRGGMYISQNNGTTWALSPIVGAVYITDFASSGNNMYAVINYSDLYLSTDLGLSWHLVSASLPIPPNDMNSVGVSGTNVFVGTKAHGLWSSPISSLNTPTQDLKTNVQLKISIFPNPTQDLLCIDSQGQLVGRTYQILNVLGVPVMVGTLTNQPMNLSIKNLSLGVYFLKIDGVDGVRVVRN
jgi:photosystem II stability/assembly factor-like uncharacterized protein